MNKQVFLCSVVVTLLGACALAHAQTPLVVVSTGDSITNGYGTWRLGLALGDEDLIYTRQTAATHGLLSSQYVGLEAHPANGGLRDYAADVLASEPDVIVFMLGTNDAAAGVDTATYQANITTVFDAFSTSVYPDGRAPIVVVNTLVPIIKNGYEAANAKIAEQINPWLIAQAGQYGFTLVDVGAEIQSLPNWQNLYNDGIHLWANNAQGYYWMAERVAAQVATLTTDPSHNGDLNGNGRIDPGDVDLMTGQLGVPLALSHPRFNLVPDGVVDEADKAALIHDFMHTKFGDVNLDGSVSLLDLDTLALNLGGVGGWGDGDFNGDGYVSLLDIDYLGTNFEGSAATPLLAPEPATAFVMVSCGLAATFRRRQRCV